MINDANKVFDDTVSEILIKIIQDHSTKILEEPSKMTNILKDYLQGKKKEIVLISISLENGLAEEIYSMMKGAENKITLENIVQKIKTEYSLTDNSIEWVSALWKFVFEKIENINTEKKAFHYVSTGVQSEEQFDNQDQDYVNELEYELKNAKEKVYEIQNTTAQDKKAYKALKEKNEALQKNIEYYAEECSKRDYLINETESKVAYIKRNNKTIIIFLVFLVIILAFFLIRFYSFYNSSFYEVRNSYNEDYNSSNQDSVIYDRINIELTSLAKVWIEITVDNSVPTSFTLNEESKIFEADESIEIVIGNAGGLSIRLNDHILEAEQLGRLGEVIKITINKDEETKTIQCWKNIDGFSSLLLELPDEI